MPSGVRHVSFETSPPASFAASARHSSSDLRGNSPSATNQGYLCTCGRLRSGAGGQLALGSGDLGSGFWARARAARAWATPARPTWRARSSSRQSGQCAARRPRRVGSARRARVRVDGVSNLTSRSCVPMSAVSLPGMTVIPAPGGPASQSEVAAYGRRHGEAKAGRSTGVDGAAPAALHRPGRTEVHAVVGPDLHAPTVAAVLEALGRETRQRPGVPAVVEHGLARVDVLHPIEWWSGERPSTRLRFLDAAHRIDIDGAGR